MKNFFVALIILAVALATQSNSNAQSKLRDSMIVSTEWLAEHLNDDSIVLLQVGDKKEYDAAHIPGAQYIQTSDISTPRGTGLILELPPVDQLKATFEKFGVTDKSRIVVYFSKDWVTPTARVYFTLDYLGLGDRTSILDGGLPAWQAEHRPVTAEVRATKTGNFTPHPNANAGQMPRAGHIPSAKSIPFSTLVEESNNKFKSADALRGLFTTAGVKPKDSIATYCHIGQQASLLYFVARYLGYDAHLYDGSFQDWSNRKDLPVEKSPDVKTATKP